MNAYKRELKKYIFTFYYIFLIIGTKENLIKLKEDAGGSSLAPLCWQPWDNNYYYAKKFSGIFRQCKQKYSPRPLGIAAAVLSEQQMVKKVKVLLFIPNKNSRTKPKKEKINITGSFLYLSWGHLWPLLQGCLWWFPHTKKIP